MKRTRGKREKAAVYSHLQQLDIKFEVVLQFYFRRCKKYKSRGNESWDMKIVIPEPARARINSESDVSRAIFNHLRARLASRTHQRITSRARLIRIKQDARASKPVRSNISPEAVTFSHTDNATLFGKSPALLELLIPSFSLSREIIDPPFSTNCSFLVFQCSTNLLNVYSKFILSPSLYVRLSFDQLKKQFEGE